MKRTLISALAAGCVLALGGCALGPTDAPSSVAAAPSRAGSGTATTVPVSAPPSPTVTGIPSVAPGATVSPSDFVAGIRAAMSRETSYEYVTDTTLNAGGTSMTQSVHTVVDQADRAHPSVLTETKTAGTTMQLIMIGSTQYSRTNDGKYRKTTLPADATSTYVSVGSEIQQGAKTITYVGPDQVDGTPASHYTAEMLGYPGASASASGDSPSSSYDIWTDSQGRLLRVKAVVAISTTTQTYSHYGSAAPVNAPDPSQVEN